MDTCIEKGKLLEILKKNREQHATSYTVAVDKYRRLAIQQLTDQCARLVASKSPLRVNFTLPVPERHLSDYDRVIQMVELDQRESIILDERDAARYIMDHWEWERSFLANTMSYAEELSKDKPEDGES